MKNYFLITFICVILSIGELNAQAIDKQTSKEGKVWYKITSNTGKVGVADKDGNIIIPAEHYRISYFDDANVYKVYSDRMHICLYDLSGKPLIYNDSGFNYIHYYAEEGFYIAKKDSKYSIFSLSGKCIIPLERGYSKIRYSEDLGRNYAFYYVYKDDKEGVCDLNGKEIIKPIYNSVIYSSFDNCFSYKTSSSSNWVDLHKVHIKPKIWISPTSAINVAQVQQAEISKMTSKPMMQHINRFYNSNPKISKHLGKEYDKGIELILAGQNLKAVKYFHKFVKFNKNGRIERIKNKHAYYQLAHFYNYGKFDIYYNGNPGNIERDSKSIIRDYRGNKIYGLTDRLHRDYRILWQTSDVAGRKTLYDSDIPLLTDLYKHKTSSNDKQRVFATTVLDAICTPNYKNKVTSLYQVWKELDPYPDDYIKTIGSISEHLMPYLARMTPATNDGDLYKNTEDIYKLSLKEYDNKKALYLAGRAAIEGNFSALSHIYTLLDKKIYTSNRVSSVNNKLDIATDIYKYNKLEIYKDFTKLYVDLYKIELAAAKQKQREQEAQEAAERARKWQVAGSILLGLGQAALDATSAYYGYKSYGNYYSGGYSGSRSYNSGNNNALLDPRLAILQFQEKQQAQYLEFCKYQKKSNGENYTFDEWSMMNAAANYNPGGRNSGGGSSSLDATIAASKESRQQRSQEYLDRYGYKDCYICHGSGTCETCNGKGWYYGSAGVGQLSCPNCYIDSSGRRTGKCGTCQGTGKVYGLR